MPSAKAQVDFSAPAMMPAAPLSGPPVPPTPNPPSDPAPTLPIESTPMGEAQTPAADGVDREPSILQTMPSNLPSPLADFEQDPSDMAGLPTATAAPGGTGPPVPPLQLPVAKLDSAGEKLQPPEGYPGAHLDGDDSSDEGGPYRGVPDTSSGENGGDGTRGFDVPRSSGGFFSRLKRFFAREVMRALCGRSRPHRPHHGGYGGYGRPGRPGRYGHHGHHGRPGRHGRHRPRPRPPRHGYHGGGYGPPAPSPTGYSLPGYGAGYGAGRRDTAAPPPGYPA